MPIVLRIGPYRIGFFAADRTEPLHVHVMRERKMAKFWLDDMRLAFNQGFADVELNRIRKILAAKQDRLREAWHENFKSR